MSRWCSRSLRREPRRRSRLRPLLASRRRAPGAAAEAARACRRATSARVWAAALVACLAVAYLVVGTRPVDAKPPLTMEQIDAGIRQSIEDKPLVSPASRAYDAIIPSVVRVVGLR